MDGECIHGSVIKYLKHGRAIKLPLGIKFYALILFFFINILLCKCISLGMSSVIIIINFSKG